MKTIIPIESHQQMKQRHSKEINNIKGLFWAFNDEQFTDGIKTKEQKKTEYEIIMAKFNKRKVTKGVITEQKQVYLSGRA